MKIAIYHDLQEGGALFVLNRCVEHLTSYGHHIEVFTPNISYSRPNNIFEDLFTSFYKMYRSDKEISQKIRSNSFSQVLVFPSLRVPFPHILRFLHKYKINSVYMFQEPRREFFESDIVFNYYSPKNILIRILRLPLLFLDFYNSIFTQKIISNSYYSQYILKKYFGKESIVIQPGIDHSELTIRKKRTNLLRPISIGQLAKLKGHDFSLQSISNIFKQVVIIGRFHNKIEEFEKLQKKCGVQIVFRNDLKKDSEKMKTLHKYSLYLANNYNEPFGLSTLEAIVSGIFVLGINEAGTSEIIRNGVNGLLYPRNVKIAFMLTKNILQKSVVNYFSTNQFNWNKYTAKLHYVLTKT